MILIIPVITYTQTYDYKYAAQNKSSNTLKKVEVISNKTKTKFLSSNYYRGILLTENDLKGLLEESFAEYGIAGQIPTAIATINCESGFQVDPPHNNDCRGVAQFKKSTWDYFNKERGTNMDLMNPLWQIDMLAWAWKQGYQNQWECYNMARLD